MIDSEKVSRKEGGNDLCAELNYRNEIRKLKKHLAGIKDILPDGLLVSIRGIRGEVSTLDLSLSTGYFRAASTQYFCFCKR